MVAFSIGNFPIYWYGIFYLIAFITAYFFLKYVGKSKLFADRPKLQNLLEKQTEDIVIYAVAGVLIGGRLGQILIYDFQYYLHNPTEIIAVRKGGMSFIGGAIGVFLSFLLLKKIKKLKRSDTFLLFDTLLVIVGLGIMLGRIGNFLNQELYGIIVPATYRGLGETLTNILKNIHIFHVYPQVDEALRVNTNFLASFFEGFAVIIITGRIFYKRLKTKTYDAGRIAGVFLTYYSIIRFLLEYMRMDSQSEFIGPFTKSQWFFIMFFIIGRTIMLYKKVLQRIIEQKKTT